VKGEVTLRVSVKGSQDGEWGLTQSHLTKGKADYQEAVGRWLMKHRAKTVFCLVQFAGLKLDALPRMYLARPSEIAARLKATARGRGDTILYESKHWGPRARGSGTVDEIPASWRFSSNRLDALAAEV
jgi:hypothetical protein